MKKSNNLTWGLFTCRFPYHWGKDFTIMLKRLWQVIRKGFYPQAYFETYTYFIDQFKDILTWYKEKRVSTPVIVTPVESNSKWEKENSKAFEDRLNKMIAELDKMRIDPLDHPEGYAAGNEERETAKEEFFEMFEEIFYDLWD